MEEKLKFKNDYFSYLEQNENSTRYTVGLDFINRVYNDPNNIEILDLGCGNGILSKYVYNNMSYTGIDHNTDAISYANMKYRKSNANFENYDNMSYINKVLQQNKKYDAIFMSEILFHNINIETLESYNDKNFLKICSDEILKEHGKIVIIAPFAYMNEDNYWDKLKWKYNSVMNIIDRSLYNIIFESVCKQIGLEKKILEQSKIPDWFESNENVIPQNKFNGKFLGSITIIIEKIK